MCGIFCIYGYIKHKKKYNDYFLKLQNRGPDKSDFLDIVDNKVFFGFHRLAINDLTEEGNQPIDISNNHLICNGEIFNYLELQKEHTFNYKSKSDCEVILHMYKKYGIYDTLLKLDGEFSFCLYDKNKHILYAARDPFGVRPLFKGTDKEGNIFFSSEAKGLVDICSHIERFPPGCYWDSETKEYKSYYQYVYTKYLTEKTSMKMIYKNIRETLIKAVEKRMMSDRPIGCLLSGGLDSSLISSIVARKFKELNKGELHTFSIGMKGGTDLKYSEIAAKHIGSNHHAVELDASVFLKAIPEVIYWIESYDTTTVRASVGNYLIGKYIKENTDITVVFNGDGSDEQSGYLYLQNAPNSKLFHKECIELLKNIHMFDCLRSDRSISSRWSLEARTPFLDKDFVDIYMNIKPKLKMYSSKKIEKFLLRKSFEKDNYLPSEILWRKKEAFSDGCSSQEHSWNTVIKNHVDKIITDSDFMTSIKLYTHNIPKTKEDLYYRRIFDTYYPSHEKLIDFYWMPKWCGEQRDPSARELPVYKE